MNETDLAVGPESGKPSAPEEPASQTATLPGVPAHIQEWADRQDFRAIVRRVVSSLRVPPRRRGDKQRPLWSAVADTLCVGSTYASRYCVLFGFDPDEVVRC